MSVGERRAFPEEAGRVLAHGVKTFVVRARAAGTQADG